MSGKRGPQAAGVSAGERDLAGEVELVGQHRQRAGGPVGADAARGVGHHQRPRAEQRGEADREDHVGRAVALVAVDPAAEVEDRALRPRARASSTVRWCPATAWIGNGQPVGERLGAGDRLAEVDREAGAGDQRDVGRRPAE